MMNKRIIRVILSIVLILSLSACRSGNNLEAEYKTYTKYNENPIDSVEGIALPEDLVDNTTPYEELITKEIDIHIVAQNLLLSSQYPSIEKIMEYIGIECLRYTEDGCAYSIHKVKQGGWLYIFYWTGHKEPPQSINELSVKDYYYVHEKISSKDFDDLVIDKSTIDDVAKIDKGAQIYENIFVASAKDYALNYSSQHYLDDGILIIEYQNVDGKFVVYRKHLSEDYDLGKFGRVVAIYVPCFSKILEADWPKTDK